MQTSILDGLGVDPSNVQDQYNQLLVVKRDTGSDHSWWDILGDLNGFTVEIIISGVLWLVGEFASLLIFWAYIMAAVLSTLSTAAGHGSAGAIIIAGSGLPPRSARGRPGDDITGDKSVRDLIAKTKGNYF